MCLILIGVDRACPTCQTPGTRHLPMSSTTSRKRPLSQHLRDRLRAVELREALEHFTDEDPATRAKWATELRETEARLNRGPKAAWVPPKCHVPDDIRSGAKPFYVRLVSGRDSAWVPIHKFPEDVTPEAVQGLLMNSPLNANYMFVAECRVLSGTEALLQLAQGMFSANTKS